MGTNKALPESASGTSPMTVVIVVSIIGRNRFSTASTHAVFTDLPSVRSVLIKSISTIALLTTIPSKLTIPSIATKESSNPRKYNPKKDPIADNGIVSRMINGCVKDLN